MKIAIASDHAAIDMKAALAKWLRESGHEVTDLGADSRESVDYPDYGYALAEYVAAGKAERGVALCGTGIGISIAANRHPAIRCAVVTEPFSAQLARDHNDANILALGERILGLEMAKACLKAFIDTDSGSGERHARRIGKLTNPPVEMRA